MSLARAALRFLVVEALSPYGANAAGPWPTVAKARIYDSRLVPPEDLSTTERRPIVIVYTDEVEDIPRQNTGRGELRGRVDLRFELAVPQLVQDEDQAPEAFNPVTDPETEGTLDLLESQIRFCLNMGPSGELLRKLMPPKLEWVRSEPFRTAEERVRISARTLTLRLVEFKGDCFDPAPETAPTGLDRLPDPLRTVAKALPAGSYGRVMATALADFASGMPLKTPLERVGLTTTIKPTTHTLPSVVDLPQDP